MRHRSDTTTRRWYRLPHVIARISWRDAFDLTKGEWAGELPPVIECIIDSVGHVLRETDDFVVICHSVAADGMFQGAFAIPTMCIVDRSDYPDRSGDCPHNVHNDDQARREQRER